MNQNIAVLYFSATGITEAFAAAIETELERLGCNAEKINITARSARESKEVFDKISSAGCLIFGFPVFKDFAPEVVDNWTASSRRQRAKMRHVLHLRGKNDRLRPLPYEDPSGKGRIQGRAYRRIPRKTLHQRNRMAGHSRPAERTWCNPVRNTGSCSMCRLCEEECPAGAMSADTGIRPREMHRVPALRLYLSRSGPERERKNSRTLSGFP